MELRYTTPCACDMKSFFFCVLKLDFTCVYSVCVCVGGGGGGSDFS